MCDVDLAARNYIEEKGYGQYFTHRTGHSIGLEDHEFGDVSSVNEDIIQVGQCFSVEPGIYLAEEGIGVRNYYRGRMRGIESFHQGFDYCTGRIRGVET